VYRVTFAEPGNTQVLRGAFSLTPTGTAELVGIVSFVQVLPHSNKGQVMGKRPAPNCPARRLILFSTHSQSL